MRWKKTSAAFCNQELFYELYAWVAFSTTCDGFPTHAPTRLAVEVIVSPPVARKQVALVFPMTVSWLAVLADGVAEYARLHGGWLFTTSPPTLAEAEESAMTVYSLRQWPGDGAIAVLSDAAEARAARRLTVPVVGIGGNLRRCGVPRVMGDQYAVGWMAAEHFINRGLSRLAYHGLSGPWYSQERQRGFVACAAKSALACEVFNLPPNVDPRRVAPPPGDAGAMAAGVRPPVGVLAVHDYRARVLIDECIRLGLDVPHDVAVLGVNNDLTACEFCQPTLSSVSHSAWRIGYEAARRLDQAMSGQTVPTADVLIPPDGIILRRSTDTIAVDDRHVSAAVHYMRDHLAEPFGIERVMKHVPVSRRRLHEQFQRFLKHTPYEYLCNLRVERAKQLLSAPQRMKMRTIASACGFSSAARMRLVFRRVTGTTPLAYRRLYGEIAASKSTDQTRQHSPGDAP